MDYDESELIMRVRAATIASCAAILITAGSAGAAPPATWYAAPGGSDANSCAAPAAPCATIDGAIGKASAGDTIRVAAGTYTAAGAQVVLIDESVTLEGGWDATFTHDGGPSIIDGGGARQGVRVAAVTASISGFVVQNATRGILNTGTLAIDETTIQDNTVGGVYSTGPLTIVRSAVVENSANATLTAGGISVLDSTASISNTTIANNTQAGGGAGIWLAEESYPEGDRPVLRLNNVTITGNSSSGYWGAGVRVSTGTVYVANSIVYGNASPFTDQKDFGLDGWTSVPIGSVVSLGNNLATGFAPVAGDIQSGDARLGPLSWDVGATDTIPLRPGSPALDMGNPAGCRDENGVLITSDQRGGQRPSGGRCDIGAYEAQPPPNDAFGSSESLGGLLVPLLWSNRFATKETGEPWQGSDAGGASVWFSWAPSFTGIAYVSTAGSDFDTTLGVYTGSNVSSLTPVASNDDGTRSVSTSRACFPATSGSAYRVAVDGYGAALGYEGSEGDIQLSWGPYLSADPCALTPPTVAGSAAEGATLTATTGTWVGTVTGFEYQWIACAPAGQPCYTITGATGPSYRPVAEDVGFGLSVRVMAKQGSDASLDAVGYSTSTSPVTPAPPSNPGGPSGGGGGAGSADLYLTGSVEPVSAPVGGSLTWRLRVLDDRNYKPASGVFVDVTLPAGVQVVSTSADRGPGCASNGTGKLRCNLDWLSSDAPYGNITITTNVTAAGELALTATAGYAQADPNPADNTVTLKANLPAAIPPPATPVRTPTVSKGVTRTGTAKANTMFGTVYADVLRGLGGNDSLNGRAGSDKLYGGAGNDTLTGGPGADLLDGNSGNDLVFARDRQRDTIHCGPGKDVVTADKSDTIGRDCETIRRG